MPDDIGLPVREFFYTLDQIGYMLEIKVESLKVSHLHFEGRSVGVCPKEKMLAVNIAVSGTPDWRVAERHFKRWLKFKGYKFHERGYLR